MFVDLLIPINENQSTHLILGVMTCLKNILTHLSDDKADEGNKGDSLITVDKLLQVLVVKVTTSRLLL